MPITEFTALSSAQQDLLNAAAEAMEKAYSPYSNFLVGAAVRSVCGKIITGSNVEQASYENVHAEAAALVQANALGYRQLSAIAIITRGRNFDSTEIFGPCGGCRQRIYEFAQISKIDIEVIVATTRKDKILLSTINELLPYAFGPRDLGISIYTRRT